MRISFDSVKMLEKTASSTLKMWQRILLEKTQKKQKDMHKIQSMKQKT